MAESQRNTAVNEPRCVRPDHLFLGTQQQNIADRHSKQRTASGDRHGSRLHPELMPRGDRHSSKTKPWSVKKGETHPHSKLTDDQVREIRATYRVGVTSLRQLANRFAISIANVSIIVRREGWRHVA